MKDVHGEISGVQGHGFSLVITSNNSRVLGENVLVVRTIVSAAIIFACLLLRTGRASLVATAQLTVILFLVLIDDNIPKGNSSSNTVVIYLHCSLSRAQSCHLHGVQHPQDHPQVV